jgi:glycosyltransferase
MKISIITVVYNNVGTIEHAINSVLNQTYFPNVEYIIIDGGSTDGTIELIDKYQNYIDIIISENDNGIYDAMNKGISLATGNIVGILNSDDLYIDNTILEIVCNEFQNDTNLKILYGDLVYVDKNDTNKIIRKWISCDYDNNFFERGNVPPHPSLFLMREVYNTVGMFNLKYKLASDYEFMLRVFKKFTFKTKYLNQVFVKMRLGGATNKNLRNIFLGNIEILKAWKNNSLKIPILFIPKRILKRLLQYI